MAKKSMIERNKKREYLTQKHLTIRKKLRETIKQTKNFDEQLQVQNTLQKLPRNSLSIRLRNRCIITGRSRGYFRYFGVSRHVLREMGHDGLIPGLIKSSW
uniref:Small ribosomal subunit protein uS14c n=1 Tax=Porolithon onkodes TaxID=231751 RepID=A0A2Z2L3E1_9FLOR|nr:ribosomal protein S14 [Porolithon onkodes]ASB29723.1 ribosomal protein S14 [Porolithon onkodes]